MRPLIGRTRELTRLRRARAESPQLVVVRGRRRVGKSFLINHAFADDPHFIYFQADEGPEGLHLGLLASQCEELTGAPVRFQDWNAALDYVATLATDKPIVLALDEFQWMWRAQDALPSTVMRHFDRWQRDGTPVCLVISGSELTMMERLTEGDKPLFGRAAARLLIEPFDFREVAAFGPQGASPEERLRRFAVLGGTAQYQAWAGDGDLDSILKERILTPGESLFDEPLQLLRGERDLRDPGSYFGVLRAIASGRTQFNEIQQAVSDEGGGGVAVRLQRLQELGYIALRDPVAGNGTKTYVIADPYFRFWFRFVWPNRSRLQSGRIDEVHAQISGALDDFMGPVFESACRQWARAFSAGDGVFAEAQTVGGYWTRTHDVEIDVVAMTKSTYLALGSCKWSKHADARVLDRLLQHRDQVRGVGDPKLFVFARGFDASLLVRAKQDDVTLIGLDELFA